MKIAFWSNGGEKMCVTANMASIASMVSLRNFVYYHTIWRKSRQCAVRRGDDKDFFALCGGKSPENAHWFPLGDRPIVSYG